MAPDVTSSTPTRATNAGPLPLGRIAADLALVLGGQAGGAPWAEAGKLLGQTARAFLDAKFPPSAQAPTLHTNPEGQRHASLAWLLEPFFEAVTASNRRLTKEEVVGLLEAMGSGDDLVLHAASETVWNTWGPGPGRQLDLEQPPAAPAFLAAGAEAPERVWLWALQWLAQILGFLQGLVDQILERFRELSELFDRVQGLPEHLVASSIFGEARSSFDAFVGALEQGAWQTLRDEAWRRQVSIVDVTKRLLTEENPLARFALQCRSALLPLLGPAGRAALAASQLTEQGLTDLQRGVDDLTRLERQLWEVVFGGAAGEGPYVVLARGNGVFDDEPANFGGGYNVDWSSFAGQQTFLALEGRHQTLQVPHPAEARRIDWDDPSMQPPTSDHAVRFDMPIAMPNPVVWDASVAVAHLPEFFVVDMRYHMPYGAVGLYKVVDLDGDGEVGPGDVQRVRDALGTADAACDVNGDGIVTEEDVRLAEEQEGLYLAQVMYRRVEKAPLGFWVSMSPYDWAFATVTSCHFESIPGKVERRGVLALVEGQVRLPLPPIPGLNDGSPTGVSYPIRYHAEWRLFLDAFPAFDLLTEARRRDEEKALALRAERGQAPPPAGERASRLPALGIFGYGPPVPGVRHDLIVRGGPDGCRDWQFHGVLEPFNPMLRTWTLRCTLFVRGLLTGAGVAQYSEVGAGAGGKADIRIFAVYETGAPLIDVLAQWHGRFSQLAADVVDGSVVDALPEPPTHLPIPWRMIVDTLEYTELPRLCRGLVGIAGPFFDLLLDWTDPHRHLRGVLGHIRQSVLNQWKPAPTWAQVRREVESWDVPWPARSVVLDAISRLQAELAAANPSWPAERPAPRPEEGQPRQPDPPPRRWPGDHDAVHCPILLHRRCKAALEAPPATTPAEPPRTRASARTSSPSAARTGRAPLVTSGSTGPVRSAPAAPTRTSTTSASADGALEGKAAALAQLDALFKDQRGRFAASLDQLVPHQDLGTPMPEVVPESIEFPGTGLVVSPKGPKPKVRRSIPLCGTFEVTDPHLITNPITLEDIRRAKSAHDENRDGGVGVESFDGSASEQLLDDATLVRGNPFYKGIYHTIIEFGPDAKLYLAPNKALDHLLTPVGAGEKGMVEGRRALRHEETGDVWLWVRLTDWRHGWLCIEKRMWEALRAGPEQLVGVAGDLLKDVAAEVIDPAIMATIEELLDASVAKRPIRRLEASSRDTLDESGYAWVCRDALNRLSVGAPRPDDHALQVLYEATLHELKIRVFGYEYAKAMFEDGAGDTEAENLEFAQVFNTLSHAKRESLWLAGTSWMKCYHYVPHAAEEFLEVFLDAVLGRHGSDEPEPSAGERMEKLWHELCKLFARCADVTLDEVVVACQLAAPSVKEVVMSCMDIAQKLMMVIEMIQGIGEKKEKNAENAKVFQQSGGGSIPPGFGALDGDPTAPEWMNVGVMLARLLIDDPEEPGRPPPAAPPPGRDKKKYDWGITFSYDVSISEKEQAEAQAKPPGTENLIRLAVPAVTEVLSEDEGAFTEMTLRVTRWGAVVFDLEGPRLVESVPESRFPPGLRPEDTAWEITRDGGITWETLADHKGPEITYTIDPDRDRGALGFQAYLGRPLRDLGVLTGPPKPEPSNV